MVDEYVDECYNTILQYTTNEYDIV